jgi:hypothetical protein
MKKSLLLLVLGVVIFVIGVAGMIHYGAPLW